MDSLRSIDGGDVARDYPAADEPAMEAPPAIGTDERRMHVRAYNFWVSLLDGRSYPTIAELDAARVPDFGAHGVVLDFAGGARDPAIPFVGAALCEEGGHDMPIARVSDVPCGSLLSRLTGHIDEILANRAPIGFEAEFVNHRQRNMMYRGILMPFSDDGREINAIYGVINWKEALEDPLSSRLSAELGRVMRELPPPPVAMPGPVWADGPNAPLGDALPPGDGGGTMPASGLPDGILPPQAAEGARVYLRHARPCATIDMPDDLLGGDGDEFVLLVARRQPDGRLGLLGAVEDAALRDAALRRMMG